MSGSQATTDGDLAQVLASAVDRRRNFAIISHPDAGKTTLTEKCHSAGRCGESPG